MDKKSIFVTRPSMPPYEEYVRRIKSLWDKRILTNMGEHHQTLEKCLCMCFNNGYYITIENCYILNEESKVFLGLGINNTHTVGHLKNASDKIFGIAHEYGKALEEIDVHRPLINDIKITNNILTEKGENLMTENNENIILEGDSNGK